MPCKSYKQRSNKECNLRKFLNQSYKIRYDTENVYDFFQNEMGKAETPALLICGSTK